MREKGDRGGRIEIVRRRWKKEVWFGLDLIYFATN